jgi:DNA-binding response OmpR family regulator
MAANKRILIIDDEEDIRFLLKRFLLAHDYEVTEAENLKQGFEIYKQDAPSIIILDVNLPDGNGINYAREFKKDGRILIFISADNDQLTNDYKKYGADAFLRKPFNAADLLNTIDRQQRA